MAWPFQMQSASLLSQAVSSSADHFGALDPGRSTAEAHLQADCPGVGLDLIRRVLARLQKGKKVRALGTGRGARWEKLGNQVLTRKLSIKLRIMRTWPNPLGAPLKTARDITPTVAANVRRL